MVLGFKRLWLVTLCFWLLGCGYRFAGPAKFPADVTRIFIEVLQNKTAETGIESIITDALIHEFTRNRPEVLSAKKNAQAYFTGTVAAVNSVTIARQHENVSRERRVNVAVSLRLESPEGRNLWADQDISATEIYRVSSDKLVTEHNRRSAIAVLSQRLAEDIFRRLTESF